MFPFGEGASPGKEIQTDIVYNQSVEDSLHEAQKRYYKSRRRDDFDFVNIGGREVLELK